MLQIHSWESVENLAPVNFCGGQVEHFYHLQAGRELSLHSVKQCSAAECEKHGGLKSDSVGPFIFKFRMPFYFPATIPNSFTTFLPCHAVSVPLKIQSEPTQSERFLILLVHSYTFDRCELSKLKQRHNSPRNQDIKRDTSRFLIMFTYIRNSNTSNHSQPLPM